MTAKLKKTNNQYHEQCKFLVVKFIKKGAPINWGNEIKIASYLITTWGFDLLNHLELGFFLNSLAFLRSVRGIEILEKEKKERDFVFKPEQQIFEFSEEKIGEDKVIDDSKPKSLLDFIK